MTRFARAKGSKSSNEKAPEDSTPWEVMKEQLLQAKKESDDNKKRQEAEQKRVENYENFLKEHKVLKRKATWCDFPESSNTTNVNPSPKSELLVKKKKKNKNKVSNDSEQPIQHNGQDHITDNSAGSAEKNKKKKNKPQNIPETQKIESDKTPANNQSTVNETNIKKNKKKQKKKSNKLNTIPNQNNKESTQEHKTIPDNNETINKTQEKQVNPKKKKNTNGQPVRRKEINDNSFQLIINGKEVELVRFDGFPVMKKDAERLKELKSNMIKKGIPKSEVQRTIKLERRRAEKALARVKREVCYNCRKGGHVLSDCPELKSKIPNLDAADGVCFKCGSTEHRQFECKVQRDKEFRFATCFICKEAGHIARQCPDNPKGLYPNGGGCKLCGDVTHLRKDCPTASDKKEGSNIKLQTLDSGDNIEGVDHQPKGVTQEVNKKPKKIRF